MEGVFDCCELARQRSWCAPATLAHSSTHMAVANNVKEANDVGSTGEVLQNLDLALDLLLLDGLEDLDDALLVRGEVDRLEDLRGWVSSKRKSTAGRTTRS